MNEKLKSYRFNGAGIPLDSPAARRQSIVPDYKGCRYVKIHTSDTENEDYVGCEHPKFRKVEKGECVGQCVLLASPYGFKTGYMVSEFDNESQYAIDDAIKHALKYEDGLPESFRNPNAYTYWMHFLYNYFVNKYKDEINKEPPYLYQDIDERR